MEIYISDLSTINCGAHTEILKRYWGLSVKKLNTFESKQHLTNKPAKKFSDIKQTFEIQIDDRFN